MSDTITPETEYPSFSEATENDVREDPTIEQSEPVAEPEPVAPPPAETEEVEPEDDLQARNARLARQLREQKRISRQMADHAAALEGKRQDQPDENMQREIAIRAAQMAAQTAVNEKANAIYSQGVKAYGRNEFDLSVQAVNETFGQQVMPVLIDTLTEIQNAEKLIQHLADNPDIGDALAALPPHRLGAALEREAAKLNKPKAVSKAPPPIRPIATQPTNEAEGDMENWPIERLAAYWDKRDFQKRFQ